MRGMARTDMFQTCPNICGPNTVGQDRDVARHPGPEKLRHASPGQPGHCLSLPLGKAAQVLVLVFEAAPCGTPVAGRSGAEWGDAAPAVKLSSRRRRLGGM